jgi:hypothetical protein
MSCDLCEAAPLTERYFEDEHCWIAECEACFVPMVVWKCHDPVPPEHVKEMLHRKLIEVATQVFDYEPFIDDNMRNIPDHYHAHARWRGAFFSQLPPRRVVPPVIDP